MDPTEEERDFARIARRIADGMQVDWERESREGTTTKDQVRHLKLVERISDAHRQLLLEESPFDSWGPLDLKQAAASGGFGEVFLAHDRNLDTDVALKLFSAARADDAFIEEARRLASVRHANVVTVHGVDRHEGRTGLWMEWIDGETLETLVDDQGPYAAAEAARIGVELCRALAAIHGAGLVHRDVKLSNVMRERGGRIVLMDFGSSTRGKEGERPSDGTPVYLPPEAFENDDSGQLADIYALGVLLYRLTCEHYPLELGSMEEMRQAHRDGKLVPLRDRNPNLSPQFVRIVERAMHPDPKQRFASAGEMERALVELLVVPTTGWKRMALWAATVLLAVTTVAFGMRFLSPPAFAPETGFYRLTEEGPPERLVSGVRVQSGDQLFLEFETNRRSWLYVINADSAGGQYLLFPVPGLGVENPLSSGEHVIPGEVDGADNYWNVQSTGGKESLLVVASIKSLDFIEEKIANLHEVVPGQPVPLGDGEILGRLRGLSSMSPSRQTPSSGPLLTDEIAKDAATLAAGNPEIRLWELTLFDSE